IICRAEIIRHNEAAAAAVLAQIRDFLITQSHGSRFGNIEERVLEDLRTRQLNDLVRIRSHVDVGEFLQHAAEEFIGKRIVVMPWRLVPELAPYLTLAALNARKDEFRVLRRRVRHCGGADERPKKQYDQKSIH